VCVCGCVCGCWCVSTQLLGACFCVSNVPLVALCLPLLCLRVRVCVRVITVAHLPWGDDKACDWLTGRNGGPFHVVVGTDLMCVPPQRWPVCVLCVSVRVCVWACVCVLCVRVRVCAPVCAPKYLYVF
jgi:hypothetical protein